MLGGKSNRDDSRDGRIGGFGRRRDGDRVQESTGVVTSSEDKRLAIRRELGQHSQIHTSELLIW